MKYLAQVLPPMFIRIQTLLPGALVLTLASAYVAYLMTQLPPMSNEVNTNGAGLFGGKGTL